MYQDKATEKRLKNIDKIIEYLDGTGPASLKETHEMFLGRITILEFQQTIQLGLDKGSFEMDNHVRLYLPE